LPSIIQKYWEENRKMQRPALIPIVSTARALEDLLRWWKRFKFWGPNGMIPDAVKLENMLAGGHLGLNFEDYLKGEYSFEQELFKVLAIAAQYGFPVIVAGGIMSRQDIIHWAKLGAHGVSIGSLLAATPQSGASQQFLQTIVESTENDIIVPQIPGSPSKLPFRLYRSSPGYQEAIEKGRIPKCNKCYLFKVGTKCPASESCDDLCLCNNLEAANKIVDYPALEANRKLFHFGDAGAVYTCGARAYEIKKIISADEVIDNLTGYPKP